MIGSHDNKGSPKIQDAQAKSMHTQLPPPTGYKNGIAFEPCQHIDKDNNKENDFIPPA